MNKDSFLIRPWPRSTTRSFPHSLIYKGLHALFKTYFFPTLTSLRRPNFSLLHQLHLRILCFSHSLDTMAPQTRSQSVAAARPPLPKPGRPPTTKGRMCQRCVRSYQTNPRGVFPCSRGIGKMKCGLCTAAKHSCIIVSRSLLT